jgi:hypothetical protein
LGKLSNGSVAMEKELIANVVLNVCIQQTHGNGHVTLFITKFVGYPEVQVYMD